MADTARLAAALGDRYRIERELGAGGMATVYLARDLKHDREVAVKVLRPELGLVLGAERFLAEIKITARLDHPHILTLIDSGSAEGLLYYVLPLVRGESLRARIDREHQMGIDDALTIVKQVGSALDYAHRHGVVHRDIKPENILIQEGEAMLADFGIALAVKEAGGNRLTESGLSLGTPQYMSPEQATGERQLDARSDVYSLAAVFYEMIAGEPPVTGATAQAMIAKLLTERPTPLQVVRDTVPSAASAAVAKALAKTPADRFQAAGDFVRALDAGFGSGAPGRGLPKRAMVTLGVAAIVVVAAIGVVLSSGRHRGPSAILGQEVQLTTSGGILAPAVSPDGKQLAYFVKRCRAAECVYDVVAQDVGGSASRVIFSGATAAYQVIWSPDRRNLLFNGSIARRFGSYLLSALGGPPRFVSTTSTSFFGGGDSLLVVAHSRPDSVHWIRVTTLDGIVHDSIRVAGSVTPGIGQMLPVPGTDFLAVQVAQEQHALWQIEDREGRVLDHVLNSCWCPGVAAGNALWLARANPAGIGESVIRVPVDPATGHLSRQQDTMFSGLFTGFSVTADGAGMVIDRGTYNYSIWAVDFPDALVGRFPESKRIAQSSTGIGAAVSPDGGRVLMQRMVPGPSGAPEHRISVRPWAGGAETPVGIEGTPDRAFWADSTTLAIANITGHGHHFALLDVRTGATSRGFDIPDSVIANFDLIADGWAWVPALGDRILYQSGTGNRTFLKPVWFAGIMQITPDASRQRLAYTGWRAGALDSIGVHVLNLADGTDTRWGAFLTEAGGVRWLNDGSLLMESQEAVGQFHLYRMRGPGQVESLGVIPRELGALTVSADRRHATVATREYHADAWLYRVVHP